MYFIQSGLFLKPIDNVNFIAAQPNPKYLIHDSPCGSIMVDQTHVAIYPLTSKTEPTLYDVYKSIINQIEEGKTIIKVPVGIKFNTVEEYKQYIASNKLYNETDTMKEYYKNLDMLSQKS